jgi:hypothetical protein
MSFFFRGKVWLRFIRDYAPCDAPVKYLAGLVTAIDAVEAECLVACGYAVEYDSQQRPTRTSESTMGATG